MYRIFQIFFNFQCIFVDFPIKKRIFQKYGFYTKNVQKYDFYTINVQKYGSYTFLNLYEKFIKEKVKVWETQLVAN